MEQRLDKLGNLRDVAANGTGDGVAKSLTVDLVGPLPGQFWILNALSAFFVAPSGIGIDFAFSGLYLVPNGQAIVTDPPNNGAASSDIPDRGIMLAQFTAADVGGAFSYATLFLQSVKDLIVPYGYFLRVVVAPAYNTAAVVGAADTLQWRALVRVLSLDGCNDN